MNGFLELGGLPAIESNQVRLYTCQQQGDAAYWQVNQFRDFHLYLCIGLDACLIQILLH